MDQNKKPKEVNSEHEQKLEDLKEEFKECFQKDSLDIGHFKGITHEIVLQNEKPAVM